MKTRKFPTVLQCLIPAFTVACGSANAPDSAAATGGMMGGAGSNSSGAGSNSSGAGSNSSGAGGGPANGTAGSGASSGAPAVHVVLPCTQLGAASEWENISPPGVIGVGDLGTSGGVSAFVVDPLNSGTVYVGTDSKSGIWKTIDCGATWLHVNTGKNGKDLDDGRNWTFALNHVDPKVMYTASGYGTLGLYRSVNAGVDWDRIWPPSDAEQAKIVNFVSVVAIDPSDAQHVLVSFHEGCAAPYGPGCFAESTDNGSTWRIISGTPSFGEQSRIYLLDEGVWLVPSGGNLWQSSDRGANWKSIGVVEAGGHSGQEHVYRGQNGAYYLGTQYGVIRSADGTQWSGIENSGSWIKGITGNGDALFAAGQSGVFRSSEADDSKWTLMEGSPRWVDGCVNGYDVDHKLLYVSCGGGGFWRVVAP